MSKIKYEIVMPKSVEQLTTYFSNLLKNNSKHFIFRILPEYLTVEELWQVLIKNKENIERFRKNKSIIILSNTFDYKQVPDFIPLAPTEKEALDIIELEEIERELMSELE